MSNLVTPREPAFSGLIPNNIKYHRLGGEVLQLLQDTIGRGDYYYKSESRPSLVNLTGYYVYKNVNNEQLFLKIVPVDYKKSVENANLISLWVRSEGIKTPTPLPELSCHIREHIVYLYEFIDGARFFNEKIEDIQSLGHGLAQLHDALLKYPEANIVKINSKRRNAELSLLRQSIVNSLDCVDGKEMELKTLLSSSEYIFDIESLGNEQVLHGDLVRGNVLFKHGETDPIFIDFEDSYFSYGCVELDIALVIERFIICGDKKTLENFGNVFSDSYLKNRQSRAKLFNYGLECFLKYLSLKALTILIKKKYDGHNVNETEWKKFINLYHSVDRNIAIIHKIENYFKLR